MRGVRRSKGRAGLGTVKVGNPIPGATSGRSTGPAVSGGYRGMRGFDVGDTRGENPVGQNDAGFQLLDGMKRGIEPAPLRNATPGGGPWVRSGKKTRTYFGP